MTTIDCPGSKTWRKGLGVEGRGLDPLGAIINGFLHLLLQILQQHGLTEFLSEECEDDCWRRVTGPEFERFHGNLELRQDGTWHYLLVTVIVFRIDCMRVVGPISNEELVAGLLAKLSPTRTGGK